MADKKVDSKALATFQQLVEESWKKNPLSVLTEKGMPGTDVSFKSPVVTPDEYQKLTKKLREQYGKKLRPWEKKPSKHPFKGPIKKLEEGREMERWDKFI